MRRRFTPNVQNNCSDGIEQTVSATMADLALHGVDNYHKLNIAVRELVSGLHSPASKPENSPRQREETKASSLPSPSQGTANGARVVEMVSSTTEVSQPRVTRPTVLREVTSYPVSSSTHQGVLIRVQNHKRTSVSLVKRTLNDEQERCGKRSRITKNVKFRRRENGSVDGAADPDRVPATSELQVEVPPINEEDMRQAILLRDEQNRCLDRSEGTVLRSPQFRVLPESGYGRNALLSYSEDVIGVSPTEASDGDFIALNFPHTSESLNLDFNMHLDGCISPGQLSTVNSSFVHNIGLQESLVGNEVRTTVRV